VKNERGKGPGEWLRENFMTLVSFIIVRITQGRDEFHSVLLYFLELGITFLCPEGSNIVN